MENFISNKQFKEVSEKRGKMREKFIYTETYILKYNKVIINQCSLINIISNIQTNSIIHSHQKR